MKNVHTDEATGKETIAPDQAEHARIVAEGGLANMLKNIDMSRLPSNLKCAVSGNILEDAVLLPCCRKTVSDGVIRAALVNSNMNCPLCHKANVSVDDLTADEKARTALEKFIVESKSQHDAKRSDDEANGSMPLSSPVNANAGLNGMDPMSQFNQNVMMMSMMNGGGQGMNPMQFQQMMMSGGNMMAPGNMMQPMPGPYPGWLVDPFTGSMLPFDPSLIPWNMLPRDEFPHPQPVDYDVFIREQKMQMDYKAKIAGESNHDSRNNNDHNNNSPYEEVSDALSRNPNSQPPAKGKKELKLCPHGRTEGYCSICNGEQVSSSPEEKPPVKQKKEVKTCPHGRTEGYCSICNGESKRPSKEKMENKQKDINTCVHGRTVGYCSICNGDGNSRDRKRSRSRERDDDKISYTGGDRKRRKDRKSKDKRNERPSSPPTPRERRVVYQENDRKKGKVDNKNDLRHLIRTAAKGKR